MAEMVNVPGLGEVKRVYVYAGGAAVAGMVAYAWWKQGTAAEDIPAYSEEDVSDAITDTPGGAAGPPANSGGAATDNSSTPDTDAEWGRMAVDMLEGSYERAAIQGAIGRFLTAQSLDKDQEMIIRAAIGVLGYPPQKDYKIITGGAGATPSALTEPTGVKVAGTSASSIRLTWTAVAGAAGYRIYRTDAGQNVGHSVDTTAVVGGLRAGEKYSFYVRAMDANGKTGPKSATVSAETEGAKLKAPTGIRLRAEKDGVVWVEWSPVSGVEGYRVYHNRSAQNVGASRDNKARISGLKQGQRYTFHVRAVDGGTTGPASAKKSITTRR